MKNFSVQAEGKVLGIDLGDRKSEYVLIDEQGEELEWGKILTDTSRMRLLLETAERCRVVIEVGSQSRWVSQLGESLGHEVLVANARRVRLIYGDENKTDHWDCRKLARLGRVDATLLYPIRHRGPEVQLDLSLLRSRDALVKNRTSLINHVRGQVKAWGHRLKKCSTSSFHRQVSDSIPEELTGALDPILQMIESLTAEIKQFEKKIEQRASDNPEIERLRRIDGVGLLSSATFV